MGEIRRNEMLMQMELYSIVFSGRKQSVCDENGCPVIWEDNAFVCSKWEAKTVEMEIKRTLDCVSMREPRIEQ